MKETRNLIRLEFEEISESKIVFKKEQ